MNPQTRNQLTSSMQSNKDAQEPAAKKLRLSSPIDKDYAQIEAQLSAVLKARDDLQKEVSQMKIDRGVDKQTHAITLNALEVARNAEREAIQRASHLEVKVQDLNAELCKRLSAPSDVAAVSDASASNSCLKCQGIAEENRKLKNDLKKAESQLVEATEDYDETESKMRRYREERDEAERDLATLQGRFRNIESQNRNMKEEMRSLQAKLNRIEDELEHRRDGYEALNDENRNLKAALCRHHERVMTDLKSIKTSVVGEKQALAALRKDAKGQLEEFQRALAESGFHLISQTQKVIASSLPVSPAVAFQQHDQLFEDILTGQIGVAAAGGGQKQPQARKSSHPSPQASIPVRVAGASCLPRAVAAASRASLTHGVAQADAEKITRLENELAAANEARQTLNERLTRLKKERDELESALKTEKNRCEALTAQNRNLTHDCSDKSEEIRGLEERNDELEKAQEQLKLSIIQAEHDQNDAKESHDAELVLLNEEIARLKSELAELRDETFDRAELESELKSLGDENRRLRCELAQEENENDGLRKEVGELERELQVAQPARSAEMKLVPKEEWERSRHAMQELETTHVRERQSLEVKLKEARGQLEHIRKHIDNYPFYQIRVEQFAQESGRLTAENKRLRDQRNVAHASAESLRKENGGLNAEIASLRGELKSKHRTENESSRTGELEEKNRQIARLIAESVELQVEAKRLTESEAEMSNKLGAANTASQRAASELYALKMEKEKLDAASDNLKKEIVYLKSSLAAEKKQTTSYQTNTNEWKRKHNALAEKHKEIEIEMRKSATDQINVLTSEKNKIKSQLEEKTKQCDAQRIELAQFQKQAEEKLNAKVAELRSQITTMENEKQALLQAEEKSSAKLTELRDQVATLENEKKQLQTEILEQSGKISKLSAEVRQLTGQLQVANKSFEAIQATVKEAEKQAEEKRKTETELRKQVAQRENELKLLQSEFEAVSVKLNDATSETDRLRVQLATEASAAEQQGVAYRQLQAEHNHLVATLTTRDAARDAKDKQRESELANAKLLESARAEKIKRLESEKLALEKKCQQCEENVENLRIKTSKLQETVTKAYDAQKHADAETTKQFNALSGEKVQLQYALEKATRNESEARTSLAELRELVSMRDQSFHLLKLRNRSLRKELDEIKGIVKK